MLFFKKPGDQGEGLELNSKYISKKLTRYKEHK